MNYAELMARTSGQYVPQSPEDFIGAAVTEHRRGGKVIYRCGAQAVARHLERAVRLARQSGNAPLKFLFNGAPGLGKTALARYLARLLNCSKWSTFHYNGTQVKIEVVEDMARSLWYRNLFGEYRLLHIDEADQIPRVAQVRFLTLLDELPPATAVVCTSNCKLEDFEERFQTRFQVFELAGPDAREIESLLRRYLPDDPQVPHIAVMACGNVRQALLDACGLVQATR